MPRPRVLLADDHAMVLAGLSSLVEREFDLVGTARDGRELVELSARLVPDVVVADISMPLLNGLDAVRRLKKTSPSVKVVFLTMHGDIDFATEAFRAGASWILAQALRGRGAVDGDSRGTSGAGLHHALDREGTACVAHGVSRGVERGTLRPDTSPARGPSAYRRGSNDQGNRGRSQCVAPHRGISQDQPREGSGAQDHGRAHALRHPERNGALVGPRPWGHSW